MTLMYELEHSGYQLHEFAEVRMFNSDKHRIVTAYTDSGVTVIISEHTSDTHKDCEMEVLVAEINKFIRAHKRIIGDTPKEDK